MKQILSIADSIEHTLYSVQRCVDTFSDYNVEPILAVPEFTDGDTSERADISAVLDYCFDQKIDLSAIFIGMIRDHTAVYQVAAKLLQNEHPAVVAEPVIISPDGKILVSRETYDAVVNALMQHVHFLVLNIYEAELFSGIECNNPAETRRAADAICDKFHSVVFIGGCKKTGGRDLLAIGGKAKWFEGITSGLGSGKKLFTAAVACELASDKPIVDAVTAARFHCGITTGNEAKTDFSFEYVLASTAPTAAPAPAPAVTAEAPKTEFNTVAYKPVAPAEAVKPVIPDEPVMHKVEPIAGPEPEQETASVAPVSSLVSPAKSIRDAARSLDPMPTRIKFGSGISIPSNGILARELAKSSPKGSLTAVTSGIESPEKEEQKSGESMIEDMREKLRRLSEM
ncbi:MAG: bifunctional hydroxymethylpyrimidine kinase/phosphomethylpyrimidine kinase [Clostridiales bacterium]|nr:bifunctional hydroxymethylpyrimidine kinase/phosphomethylpyrimidine kinase [Clostridiales bacterium]